MSLNPNKGLHKLTGESLATVAQRWPRLAMAQHHHRTTSGGKMQFADKLWLVPIYQDESREMVIVKCAQVGITEHALCSMFSLAHRGFRGMYILPSKEHRKTFVADRINPLKDVSELYDNAIRMTTEEADSNVYKNLFGKGWKFVGSNVKKDFFEFPCECLLFDEYDQLDQDNIEYAYDRVQNCARPWIWKFGNPTRDNFGIYKEYKSSSQKEWHVECGNCGHEQILDWYIHFIRGNEGHWEARDPKLNPVCIECKKPFNRLGKGRWIALNPGSSVAGYHISRLFVHKGPDDMAKIWKRFCRSLGNNTAMQAFHNNVLAVVYEESDFKVTRDVLDRAVDHSDKPIAFSFNPELHRTIMGVDQGKFFTCTISMLWDGRIHDLEYVNVRRWSDVEALEAKYNVVCTVVDANGGGYAETRDFVMKKSHRWMCYYRPKDQVKGQYSEDQQKQIVNVNRTEILDSMVQSLLTGNTKVKRSFASDRITYVDEMLVPNRITDAGGRPVWTKGKDHFFHASGYRYVAMLLSGMRHSVTSTKNWQIDKPTDGVRRELKARVIGDLDVPTPVQPMLIKRRRWHVG